MFNERIFFEQAKFNMRKQGESKSVDTFITDLYQLAKHCGYSSLHNQVILVIRDFIVVGLRDATLSEKLQVHSKLTLGKAVSIARELKTIKKQQPLQ